MKLHSSSSKLLFSFFMLILVGAVLLSLPGMTVKEEIKSIDALFTATSAVCVTGLITLDTGSFFSFWGQLVILVLIQLGGIGIITFSTFLILMGGKKISLGYENMLSSNLAMSTNKELSKIVKSIVLLTLSIEGIGAAMLFSSFSSETALSDRMWSSIFHSVSAFCNAGFSLYANNLEGFVHNVGINITIMLLIVFGGLGFINLQEILYKIRRKQLTWKTCSFFLKISLTYTVILILIGGLAILLLEFNNPENHLTWPNKIMAAFFHSVSTRTAGFNTVPLAAFKGETLFFMSWLMFIGGNSGSCAGGIKITTLAILSSLLLSWIRKHPHPNLFFRRLSLVSTQKAIGLVFMSIILLLFSLLILQKLGLTSDASLRKTPFLDYLFEIVSAFGTVGLSTGITASLTTGGKILIICLMYIGRLGPLTLALAWMQNRKKIIFNYPEETLPIG